MANYQTIRYETDQNVAIITLNRPDRRNALTQEMLTELAAAIETTRGDDNVRAAILTGAGKGFCAGQDLGSFGGIPEPEEVRNSINTYYKPVIMGLCTLPKPVIGAINGAAAGAGASLALACDLRIIAQDAFIMEAFSNIGLVPDAGSSWFLVRQLGYSRAYQVAIEAARIPSGRCVDLGLANKMASAESLMAEALAWAHALAARPTLALGLTKQAMMQMPTVSLEEAIAIEADMQAQAIRSHDHREGVTAFMEKRPPAFQGK